MAAVLAELTRGAVVESRHFGSLAVVDAEGRLQASAGDPDLVAYLRSSAKPFQALPLVASGAAQGYGLTAAELAICAASHSGEPAHVDTVTGILAKLDLEPAALRCGVVLPMDRQQAAGVLTGALPQGPLYNDCSGKHSGMLATCQWRGWPLESYLELAHPLQQEILGIVSEFTDLPAERLGLGTDGCGVPTFAAPLRHLARAWARLAAPPTGAYAEAATTVLDAMAAHPFQVAGTGRLCTELMTLVGDRVVAKSGAEGLLCLALRDPGWGVTIKIEDGTGRALPVVVSALLRQLGVFDDELAAAFEARQAATIRNKLGQPTGVFRAAYALN